MERQPSKLFLQLRLLWVTCFRVGFGESKARVRTIHWSTDADADADSDSDSDATPKQHCFNSHESASSNYFANALKFGTRVEMERVGIAGGSM